MKMKLRSIGGELVYLEDLWSIQDVDGDFSSCDGKVQAIKQSVIIDILNELFRKAAENPDDVPDELRRVIYEMGFFKRKKYNMQVEIMDALDIRIRHCNPANAKTHTKTKKLGKAPLQLIAPQRKEAKQQTLQITDNHLTPEFKEFMKGSKNSTDQHDNV